MACPVGLTPDDQTFVLRPKISDSRNSTIKTKNKIFAMPTAVPAMPPKPRAAAINAIIKKVRDQLNIGMKG